MFIVNQRQRMYFYLIGNDKLLAGQADSVIRYKAQIKGIGRLAHIHQYLCFGIWYIGYIRFLYFKRNYALINFAVFSSGAINRHHLPRFNCFCSAPCSNNTRYSKLPRYNRGMASPRAAVRNNSRGYFHGRHPIRVGHLSHQHFAFIKIFNIFYADYLAYLSAADFTSYAHAGSQYLAGFRFIQNIIL